MVRPILIIEDDPDIAEGMRYNLERQQLEARVALSGEEGLTASLDSQNPPSLIILDLMLPGMSGMELCRRLRREPVTRRTPIIMVTARSSEKDIADGLDLGADDFVTKPFSMRELLARVRAVLRRAEAGADTGYEDARLKIDAAAMHVTCLGRQLKLTRKEFALLSVLAASAGRVVTRQHLLNNVWGYQFYGDTRTLDVHIRRVRQQLGSCADSIETVLGVGYRFLRCDDYAGGGSPD
jgi:DNA-binding response OmpR family regulator